MKRSSQPDESFAVDSVRLIQSEKAYSTLRQEIISCKVLPGSKLRINEVALRLGVSVGAVREALSRIAVEELVVATAQKGFTVSPLSAAEIRDLTKTRIAIESLCLIDAIRNGGIDWESRIIGAYHTLSRTSQNDSHDDGIANVEWVSAHAEFHFSLASASTSNSLLKIRRSLYIQTERYRQFSGLVRASARDVEGEHRGLMEAALARNEQLMADRIGDHFESTMNVILTAL